MLVTITILTPSPAFLYSNNRYLLLHNNLLSFYLAPAYSQSTLPEKAKVIRYALYELKHRFGRMRLKQIICSLLINHRCRFFIYVERHTDLTKSFILNPPGRVDEFHGRSFIIL